MATNHTLQVFYFALHLAAFACFAVRSIMALADLEGPARARHVYATACEHAFKQVSNFVCKRVCVCVCLFESGKFAWCCSKDFTPKAKRYSMHVYTFGYIYAYLFYFF